MTTKPKMKNEGSLIKPMSEERMDLILRHAITDLQVKVEFLWDSRAICHPLEAKDGEQAHYDHTLKEHLLSYADMEIQTTFPYHGARADNKIWEARKELRYWIWALPYEQD